MSGLLDKLKGGDMRSKGRSEDVVTEVLRDRALLEELFAGLRETDPIVRMRAADALEKVSRQKPRWLAPYEQELLGDIAASDQQEVQWHVAQMMGRLELTGEPLSKAVAILRRYLEQSRSCIVRASALEALVDMSREHPGLRALAKRLLDDALNSSVPSLAARAHRLKKPDHAEIQVGKASTRSR